MNRPPRLSRKLVSLAWITLAGGVAGVGYVAALSTLNLFPFDFSLTAARAGLLNGATITTLIGLLEIMIWHAPRGVPLRRLPFPVRLVIKTIAYTGIIVGTLLAYNTWLLADSGGDPRVYIRDYLPLDALVSFMIALVIHFVMLTRRMIGGRVLRNIVMGRYARPTRETRVFLFADIAESSSIALCLGDVRTHALISRVFFDLDAVITAHGGEVHRYVGDQVVVTWPMEAAVRDGRCLRCALEMRTLLERRAPWYRRHHGIAPRIRAALNGGPVVAGECGDGKLEIVYFGDTVNTAARLEQTTKSLDRWLLLPSALAAQLPATVPGWTRVEVGAVPIKGHEAPVALSSYDPASLDSPHTADKITPGKRNPGRAA
ncbi:adenylate/guanylate cyclase domain-containing protein [Roseospira visakhapatnamensis]|uniref:Adenylate cyclase n=1 Tax=Roseospira visakhapatnamensis TaxID=390880 RepID=A0A7W6WBR3_9PROT|nr:adenylate/guanylate cyclase domain-containing protein [Roseospira visakhapatnamensis]MBB4267812.1 adenylate cyclase [Roseospira visakhapatnamensis]